MAGGLIAAPPRLSGVIVSSLCSLLLSACTTSLEQPAFELPPGETQPFIDIPARFEQIKQLSDVGLVGDIQVSVVLDVSWLQTFRK